VIGVAGHPVASLDAHVRAHCFRPLLVHPEPNGAKGVEIVVGHRLLAAGRLRRAAVPDLHRDPRRVFE
jgi:hypothetical protein